MWWFFFLYSRLRSYTLKLFICLFLLFFWLGKLKKSSNKKSLIKFWKGEVPKTGKIKIILGKVGFWNFRKFESECFLDTSVWEWLISFTYSDKDCEIKYYSFKKNRIFLVRKLNFTILGNDSVISISDLFWTKILF